MRLFEHNDYQQAVLAAADHFRSRGLTPAFIEKDYYVTEALRLIARSQGPKAIFKGGTSLSKGWNLIQRFSEDVDIFIDPQAFTPPLSKNGIDRELKRLRDIVAEHPGLRHLPDASQTIGGFGRSDRFEYSQKFGGPAAIANRVLVEAGTASGREPTVDVEISSYLVQFLRTSNVMLNTEDEAPFVMRLLHFRRTFVEKLFAIHAKVEIYKAEGKPIGTYARHFYDLYHLSLQPEVIAMLRSSEYALIKADYDKISRASFPKSYRFPTDMSFSNSDAIFPTGSLREDLRRAYDDQCNLLCFQPAPSWEVVMRQFEVLKDLL